MARVVSVTFETESHAQAGHFSVPKRVADFLGIGDDDAVELRVLCEGLKLELQTRLRSGLEVYFRSGDSTTEGLERIPAHAALTVTVSHPRDESASDRVRKWDRAAFLDALTESGLTMAEAEAVLDGCLGWADDNGLVARWGDANEGSILIRLEDVRLPSNVGQKQRFFSLWTTGRVELQFKGMAPPFQDSLRRGELQERLNAVEGIEVQKNTGYPNFPMAVIAQPAKRKAFLDVQDWILAETMNWIGAQTVGSRSRLAWTRSELHQALAEYEQACIDARMKPISVHSYVDYATRFVRWVFGEYRPRAARGPVRVQGENSLSVSQLTKAAKEYEQELEQAGLKPAAVNTYLRGGMFFVRWLGGEFDPGARAGGN